MKSEWMLMEQIAAGVTMYQVYRLIDKDAPNMRTNREIRGGLYENKWCAERLRDTLNKEETK